jgi:catechol 2,3-dioxygenase-like lactoylglutathione lyase family enzyme
MKSKDFYEKVLGFEVEEIQGGKFVWLNKNGNKYLLRLGQKYNNSSEYQNTNIATVLYCEDLDQTVEELKNRGLKFKGTDGSERCLTFSDPDGNWYQLVNPNE